MYKKTQIWFLIKKHWYYNLLYVLFSAFESAIETFSNYALGIWIGSIGEYAINTSNINAQNNFHLWTIIASISLVLSVAIWPLVSIYEVFLSMKNAMFLSKLIINKITDLEYQKFNQRTPGNYLSWYENDFYTIKDNFLDGLYKLINYFFNIIFIVIALFITDRVMATIIIAMFVIFNLLPLLCRESLKKINLKNSEIIEVIYNKLLKTIDLWTFFSLKNLKNKFYQLFINNYKDLRKQDLKKSFLNMPYEIFSKTLFIVGISSTFIIAIVFKNNNLIGISAMTTSILLAHEMFSFGINNVNWILKFNSVKKIYNKIFDLPNSLISVNDIINATHGFHQINIKNVSYQYQDQAEKAIEQFSYQFDRGKKYLIMAPSGYGKSTLIKIMAGFYKDYQGQVLWNNNQEIKYINDQLLRKYISYVDNNNYILTDESFETNITMWSEFNQERFNRIVKLLAINNLKGHFDHHKNALSEGQKQKIAMARMLYENKPIIFLDEALDNIDQNYKEHLIKVFQNLASWKTLIMVTHNMKPEHRLIFDQVIYLDQLRGV